MNDFGILFISFYDVFLSLMMLCVWDQKAVKHYVKWILPQVKT